MEAEKIWKPFIKQEQFAALPFSIFEALYGGAAGGGKSELLILLPLIYQFHLNSKFKGIILRRTYPELESEIIIRSHEYYKPAGGSYNSQKRYWKFPSGAYIFFGHAEYTNDIRKYDTAEYQYIAFDELTHFEEFQYLYLSLSRCRTSDPSLPCIVRSASNPGNIGHSWVRKRFIEPCPAGGKILLDKRTGTKRFFIQSRAKDNPHIDPGYISRLEGLPEAERKAKLDGDWWTFSGQMFTDWRVEPLSDEPENAQHVIKPFDIPSWWPRILSVDWGSAAMTWAGWAAVSPSGRAFLYREYACNGGEERFPHLPQGVKVSTWATDIGNLSQGENIVDFVLDSNAWDNLGEDQSIAEQVQGYSRLNPRKADKGPGSRVSGRVLIEEYLRWKPKPKVKGIDGVPNLEYAHFILRIKGTKAYEEYLNQFVEDPAEQNLPKIQIFETCQEVIKVIPICIRAESNPEDVEQFHGDDPYDGFRYLIKAVKHYVMQAVGQEREIKLREKALNLQHTNPNAFYMMMNKLESTSNTFGIKHRRKFN